VKVLKKNITYTWDRTNVPRHTGFETNNYDIILVWYCTRSKTESKKVCITLKRNKTGSGRTVRCRNTK